MKNRFINDTLYWREGTPCELDGFEPMDDDSDDDALGSYIERQRTEYRAAFAEYINDFDDQNHSLALSRQFC